MPNSSEPILRIRNVCKNFTSTKALDNFDMDIYPGEVHALLGENGAGKSTLIKILAGIFPATSGEIFLESQDIGMNVSRIPLSVIHQDLGLVDEMTVAENIALISGYQKKNGFISWSKTNHYALDLLKHMECNISPDQNVALLSAAEKSMVAISRAIAVNSRILILDEPTATLPDNDVTRLFEVLQSLKKKGMAILFVTHRLDEVFRIADRVTVLRNGKLVSNKKISETSMESLVFDIVGKRPDEMFVELTNKPRENCLLDVKDLEVEFAGPVSFQLHEGEVLALFGLRGSGHHEVGRAIFGALPVKAGGIALEGRQVPPMTPAKAMKLGIGFVSSKRHEEGIGPSFSVRENMFINPVKGRQRLFKPMSINKERSRCMEALNKFRVKPYDGECAIGTLSGGNQQKVVLARWFEADSRVFILEEPTMGVDVGAKADIYEIMKNGLENSKEAFILVSSDYEEVSRMCHRALVFNRGKIVAEVPRAFLSDNLLSGLASGAITASAYERMRQNAEQ